MNLRNMVIWGVVVVVLIGLYSMMAGGGRAASQSEISYSELLAKVTGLRLALVEARSGETLAALGSRSENAWSAAETAAWNARSPGTALRGGELLKIARVEAWRSRPEK